MYKTQELTSTKPKSFRLYKVLLYLYPEEYRKKFGEQMILVFQDQCEEEQIKKGYITEGFWLSVIVDVLFSAAVEHINIIRRDGMKKYLVNTLHINNYNIAGAILLFPFFAVLCIDLIARIAQGDLTHYNRPVYALLSNTVFYQFPTLLIWVVVFPILAILINIVPLALELKKRKKYLATNFIQKNLLAAVLVLMGFGFLSIVVFHDFAPCFMNGIWARGMQQIFPIIQYCRNA